MASYRLHSLNFDKFSHMESEWQRCLNNSQANPLFSSWVWQKTWWEIWQPRLNLELLLIGIYNKHHLIGIIPCYTYTYQYKFGIKSKRCEFIGSHSASDDSIRSEYLNFILPSPLYNKILPLVFNYFSHQNIDEVILKDLDSDCKSVHWIQNKFPSTRTTKDKGITIPCNNSFTSYLQSLGKNTRLKLYNRRNKLSSPVITTIESKSELVSFFANLNKMHLKRWGKVCFSEHSLIFHSQIAKYFLARNQLNAISIEASSKIQGVCYDITIDNITYNLQQGFIPNIDHKISMGTLILGYAIENAHNKETVEYYDLLAGEGKNTFYKSQFKGHEQIFISLYTPLTKKLKTLFFLQNIIKSILK